MVVGAMMVEAQMVLGVVEGLEEVDLRVGVGLD